MALILQSANAAAIRKVKPPERDSLRSFFKFVQTDAISFLLSVENKMPFFVEFGKPQPSLVSTKQNSGKFDKLS